MMAWRGCALILLGALIATAPCAAASDAAARRAQAALDTGAIDRFVLEQMAAQRVPGLALAITRGDRVLYLRGYGEARDGAPVTPETQYFVASLTKSFTAVAVMQLVEAGRIDLDAPVQAYLPEFTLADPAVAARITVRQLLNQTSGLGDRGFPAMRLPQPATLEERLVSLRAARPVAPPGTRFIYHDVNYQILARLVEVVGGEPFSDDVRAHVLAPLGMGRTFSALTSAEAVARADGLAQGHLNLFGIPIASDEEPGFFAGSGGIVSTAADMARYLVMHATGGRLDGATILSPEGVAALHTPPPGVDGGYAMGWIATSVDGMPVLEHNGILSTFYADMAILPETGEGIVLLYNINSVAHGSLGFPQIRRGLIALLTGSEPSPSGLGVRGFELIAGLVTLAGLALAVRGILRLPRWADRARVRPAWRAAPGILWKLVPAALALALPALVLATAGRAFGYRTLYRSMLEVGVWLGVTGLLGVANAVARIALLARSHAKGEGVPRRGAD